MKIIGGICICEDSMDRPNDEDYCSKCVVQGCLSCVASDKHNCLVCEDGLTLKDEECTCAVDGHMMNTEGVCEECQVEGCASCASGNPQQCVRCKDCQASIVNGECVCGFENVVWLNGTCVSENETVCEDCETGMSVQNGKCVCDNSSLKLDFNCQCSLCEVDGCEVCAINDSTTCVKCLDFSALLNGGECECPSIYGLNSSYSMNKTGFCFL